MNVLIAYDVATESTGGRRRLRKIAQACQDFGQRVQKSVFECQVDRARFEELERRLLKEIDPSQDNLRLYRLTDHKGCEVREHGCFRATDFTAPLVL
jgi:CRISPR-associated protein Cas2